MLSAFSNTNKPALITSPPAHPQYKIKSDASFGGRTFYNNLEFIGFNSNKTFCGMKQSLFTINPTSPDYVPAIKLTNTRFENVAQESIAYFFDPPWEWAVLDDCGEFPCTGPLNILLQFEKSVFAGSIMPLR